MSPTSHFFRAARPAFRARQFFRPKQSRFQSTTAGTEGQSWAKRMWESPVGLKTVHFWAPIMKWALVLAGVSDFARPAEKLSLTQNGALTATGLIWTRWCLIIKPKNYLLAAVNFFLGIVGIVQVTRIGLYHQSQKKALATNPVEEAKDAVKSA
ncbi:putative mitochondrial pyruvate carrier 2 [Madurella mycetomatis]|uniref:Mitochondrial pyruvate carrier n=1 Tax=Madurella mycetomatis TaxID=100816 RepID=A0A175W8F7_9PEZI|nr:putative mitochondrial pyruvate carrier 2 [Madurella mycetomatis]